MGQAAFVSNNLFSNILNFKNSDDDQVSIMGSIRSNDTFFFGDFFSDEHMYWDEYGNPGMKDDLIH